MTRYHALWRNPLIAEHRKRILRVGKARALEEAPRIITAVHEAGHTLIFYRQGGHATYIDAGRRQGRARSAGSGMVFGPTHGAHWGGDRAWAQLEANARIAGPVAERLLTPSGLKSNRSELRAACAFLHQWGGYSKQGAIDETIRLALRVRGTLLREFPKLQAIALWIYRNPQMDGAKIGLMERQLGFPPHTGRKSRARLQEPEGREWLTLFSPTLETFWSDLPEVPGISTPWGVFEEGEIVEALSEERTRREFDGPAALAAYRKKHPALALVESGR